MTLEANLFTTLGALASNRAYPDVAPQGATRPYIVYQQVGGTAAHYLESAVVGKRNARVQVSVWAATRVAAAALSRSAEDALVTSATLRALPLGAMVAEYEEDTDPPLYGARQDFSIWY